MEKINIAELLKDCPTGMKLDCTMFDKVTLLSVDNEKDTIFPIKTIREDGISLKLTKYGQYVDIDFAKCIIFPKGKTTWEGFVPPCRFKDGDIVATNNGEYIFMLKKAHTYNGTCYFGLKESTKFLITKEDEWYFNRLATEEEKQKLFQAIKDNGYRWNTKTKSLEKLIEPEFKVGSKVRLKSKPNYIYTVHSLTWDDNKKLAYRFLPSNDKHLILISLNEQDNYELVPNKFDINTLVPFESKVLVRNSKDQYWIPAFWGFRAKDGYVTTFGHCNYCIPFMGNEHLLDTTDDCDEYYKTWE